MRTPYRTIKGNHTSSGGGFSPENEGENGQILVKTEDGYEWGYPNEFVTREEYKQLPDTKLTDGRVYFIYE